jgi:hypothetical protein
MVSRERETAENAGNVATIIGVLFYREYPSYFIGIVGLRFNIC